MSEKFKLIGEDLKKIGIGFIIAALGATATWMESDLLNLIDFSNFGTYAVLAQGVCFAFNSAAVNTIRKFISSTTYTQ